MLCFALFLSMNNSPVKTIAVDLMGGDPDPGERLKAVKQFVAKNRSIEVMLFVDEQHHQSNATTYSGLESQQIHVIIAPQQVAMDDAPYQALRSKKNSSMSLAVKAVADGAADAVLTAGNTGALVVFAKAWLPSLSDVDRPALATVLPGDPKPTLLLDVGATLDYRAEDLFNLARLGVLAADQMLACGAQPEVALLNVGTEHIKGSDTIRQADHMLQNADLNYIGYCEGNHIFEGYADVVICDGFVGNTMLKACEGLMSLIAQNKSPLGQRSARGGFKKLLASISGFNFSPSQYNGALLLGMDGCVVKSHGGSDCRGFLAALERTKQYIK